MSPLFLFLLCSAMCYYDCYVYACQDWKWGNFKLHCNKEYRIGETCGMKLVHDSIAIQQKCKICDKLETKFRRREAEINRIERWTIEGRYPNSVQKSYATIYGLDQEITMLLSERDQRRHNIGNSTRSSGSGYACFTTFNPLPEYIRATQHILKSSKIVQLKFGLQEQWASLLDQFKPLVGSIKLPLKAWKVFVPANNPARSWPLIISTGSLVSGFVGLTNIAKASSVPNDLRSPLRHLGSSDPQPAVLACSIEFERIAAFSIQLNLGFIKPLHLRTTTGILLKPVDSKFDADGEHVSLEPHVGLNIKSTHLDCKLLTSLESLSISCTCNRKNFRSVDYKPTLPTLSFVVWIGKQLILLVLMLQLLSWNKPPSFLNRFSTSSSPLSSEDSTYGFVGSVSGNRENTHRAPNRTNKNYLQGRDEYDSGSGGRKPPAGNRTQRTENPSRRLACPFFQRCPSQHQRLSCCGPGFPNVHRLKQHLQRNHLRATHCHRCWENLQPVHRLLQHLEVPLCEVLPEPVEHWVDPSVLEAMSRGGIFRGVRSEEERWVILYRNLFPHDTTIPSPYYSHTEEYRQNANRDISSALRTPRVSQVTEDIQFSLADNVAYSGTSFSLPPSSYEQEFELSEGMFGVPVHSNLPVHGGQNLTQYDSVQLRESATQQQTENTQPFFPARDYRNSLLPQQYSATPFNWPNYRYNSVRSPFVPWIPNTMIPSTTAQTGTTSGRLQIMPPAYGTFNDGYYTHLQFSGGQNGDSQQSGTGLGWYNNGVDWTYPFLNRHPG